MPWITAGLFIAMFLLVSEHTGTVHGYLDPGTGSIALQLLIGGAVAALATLKTYWSRIKAFSLRGQGNTVGQPVAPGAGGESSGHRDQ